MLDRQLVLASMMMRGKIGQTQSSDLSEHLAAEIEGVRQRREPSLASQDVLVIEMLGDVDAVLKEPIREIDDFVTSNLMSSAIDGGAPIECSRSGFAAWVTCREKDADVLKIHVLDGLYRHSSNVAHGVEVPPGARLLFTNGQVGTRPDGTTPETTAEQAEVVFTRLEAVLAAANMALSDIVRLTVFLTDQEDVGTFVKARDRVLRDHKPGAIILVVKALARAGLKIEIEAIAARVDR